MTNQINRFLTRRNIFIALGVVIVLEVIWAAMTLTKSSQITATIPAQKAQDNLTSISLAADKKDVKVGDVVSVKIMISSDKLSNAADVILSYDAKLLSVETVGQEKSPVIAGNIYSAYPQNLVDEKEGKITVSGIVQTKDGVLANGLFGTVVFRSKASGKAKLSLDYTPGSTIDSNVMEAGSAQDILGQVNDLELNILP